MYSMSEIATAVIDTDGTVKGATHYHLINGGTTRVHGSTPEPIEVYNRPSAFFYGYDRESRKSVFLGQVSVDKLDKPTVAQLDKLVDPSVTLPSIETAVITHCLKRGRCVVFSDKDGNVIDASCRYNGSIDIRSAADNTRLIKPHALLTHLKEVKESKSRFWLWALLGASDTEETVKY